MIDCRKCGKLLADYLEKSVDEKTALEISGHLRTCVECERQYQELLKVVELLDRDRVDPPPDAWFESVRAEATRAKAPREPKKYMIWALIPAAAAAMIAALIIFPGKPRSVDMEIPASYLLEDNDIAAITLKGLIDDEFIADLEGLEEWEFDNSEYIINNMSEEEQKDFIEKLDKLYLIDS